MTRLLIAEKPSVARDLGRVLGATRRIEGGLEGEGLLISWCLGHLAGLARPGAYHDEWETWALEQLPMVPERFELEALEEGADQLARLCQWLTDSRFTSVINACDAGREGELIFRYVYELAGSSLPLERLWIASWTEEAITEGMRQLRPGAEFDALARAARARAQADWVVGLNATRAVTLAARQAHPRARVGLISVGRVQTPTLRLVVDRHRVHEAHTPRDYHTLQAHFEAGPLGAWEAVLVEARGQAQARRFQDEAAARALLEDICGGPAPELEQVQRSRGHKKAPRLFDLTALQRAAHERLGWTAQQTLERAQRLYETHKVLTYPRTDSRHLTPDRVDTLPGRLEALAAWAPTRELATGFVLPERPGARVVDAHKVTDHHAILPTGRTPQGLDPREAQLYELVARRMLAALSEDASIASTTVWTRWGAGWFRAHGTEVLEPGWMALEHPEAPEPDADAVAEAIPAGLKAGATITQAEGALEKGRTRAPPRLTESTLLSAMEHAGRHLEAEETAEALEETGLGTPATRAATIEKLLARGYIRRQGKALEATELGIRVIEALSGFPSLTSPELTARWEEAIERIRDESLSLEPFMGQVRAFARAIVEHFQEHPPRLELEARAPIAACPACQRPVYISDRGAWCEGFRDDTCEFAACRVIADKKLSEHQMRLLITDRRCGPYKGFTSKKGRTFEAGLRLRQDPERGWIIEFDFSGGEPARPIGPCPACAHPVEMDGRRAWCTEQTCAFGLWRTVAQKKLSEAHMRALLEEGLVGPIAGFQGHKSVFEAHLRLVEGERGHGLAFDFEQTETVGPCPACSTPMELDGRRASCPACEVSLWCERAGKKLTALQITRLLEHRRLDPLSGFRSKKGSSFEAGLLLVETPEHGWSIEFDFA